MAEEKNKDMKTEEQETKTEKKKRFAWPKRKPGAARPEKKESKVIKILKTEYPFEGILLGILGLLVVILGVYIFEGEVLAIRLTEWWIFATTLRIRIFSALVMLIGLVAILMAFAPFVIPSIKEMGRVSWPNRKTMGNHTARVLGFLFFVGLMFVIYDFILRPVFALIGE